MTSQQIRTLLAPPDTEASQRKAILSLNSRFQSLEDLDEIGPAVLQAQKLNDDIKCRLSISQSNVDSIVLKTRTSAETHLHSAQELSLLRHSLVDELTYLSQELVSSMSDQEKKTTLLEDIEMLHLNLKELQSVKGYVQIIEHALKLSESAAQQIRTAHASTLISSTSITEYKSLQEFVTKVSQSCSTIEDGAGRQTLQLVTFLEGLRDKTWGDIKATLSTSLLTASEKLRWPMPVDYTSVAAEDRNSFEIAFINLIKLQDMGETLRPNVESRSEKDGLYPLQALIQPVSLRFKYHFEGARQTNRLDKPEWYLTHVLNVAHEHRSFMESVVQKLLSSTEHRGIEAWHEFTFLLLHLLSRKLKRTIPELLPHPSLLAHTIYQALAFDAALIEEGFQISKTSAFKQGQDEDKWDGVSEVVLGRKEWFEAWMEGEKNFADDQYHEIISATDAWLVADDDGDEEIIHGHEIKTTNSARRVKALVEQVTDRYSPLPHFTQRTRFLISVQLPLLEFYHGRISSSLDAFETLSSAFVRAVPGALGVSLGGKEETGVNIDTRHLTSGVEGVQRLCKALLSAKYVGSAMERWGEELFFLELWTEINHRASLRIRAETNPLLPDPKATEKDAPQDTIFEELVIQYQKLVDRAEDMIVQQVCGEIEGGLRAHFTAATSPKSGAEHSDEIMLSQTLLGPIALLSSHLTFLRSTLPQTTATTVYRRIASRLAEHILQREILYRGHITLQQGKEILAECELWVETCHAAFRGALSGGRNRIEAPWLTLLQAARLVGAEGDAWERIINVTFGANSKEEWEEVMVDIVGSNEMTREEVGRTLRCREDCHR